MTERETWLFGSNSAALLIARAAWPFDSQVMEWAPKMLTDADLFEQTYTLALSRLAAASARVVAALAAQPTEGEVR